MKIKYWFFFPVFVFACRDKYNPDLHLPYTGYLVVEGFINAGGGPSSFVFSRSTGLDSIRIIPETGADAGIYSESGAAYPLTETTAGHYIIDSITMDPTQKYRLKIKTKDGKEYQSDYAEVKITPPIDSVSWNAGTDDLAIYVTTHDDRQQSVYYQWDYQETWQYNTSYQSTYIRNIHYAHIKGTQAELGKEIISRSNDELFPPYCWSDDHSTDIIIASSAKLSNDVIYEYPLTKISYTASNKLMSRYSILVKEYVLTKEWYEWKEKIKKNTEKLGSIFDPLPSEVGGNIHCTTDPNEVVVGFVGCTSLSEKRIFISHSDIPHKLIHSGYEFCNTTLIDYYTDMSDNLLTGTGTVITQVVIDTTTITGVFITSTECVDCRLRGGTSVKPDFW